MLSTSYVSSNDLGIETTVEDKAGQVSPTLQMDIASLCMSTTDQLHVCIKVFVHPDSDWGWPSQKLLLYSY